MAFQDIAGNNRVKKILKLALERQRVPNSMLFCGPEGVGKRKAAFVMAKALNCLNKRNDACDECENCRAIDNESFPDVLVIDVKDLKVKQNSRQGESEPDETDDGKTNRDTIGIGAMRGLKGIVYLRPMLGRKRVFIINEAEKMTEDAANSHLKILEEPPLFSHIILVSHNPALLLPTIKSRCQTLNFLPVAKEEIEQALRERGFEDEKARIMALLVHGNLEQAISQDWDAIQQKREGAWGLFRALIGREKTSLFLEKYAFQPRKVIKEDLEQTLELFSSFCRDFVLMKENGDPRLLFNPDYEPRLRESEPLLGFEQALKFLALIDLARASIDQHLNMSLLVSSFYSQVTG
jgi:DNA polymerase III delta' subunit